MAIRADDSLAMYREVIGEVMAENKVRNIDIPREIHFNVYDVVKYLLRNLKHSLRYYRTKGFARFCCTCGRRWFSAHSWCVLDLREQCVARRFAQDCNACECEAMPTFSREDMRLMAVYAVNRYLEKVGRRQRPVRDCDYSKVVQNDRGPHEEGMCEICKALGHSCWKVQGSEDVIDNRGSDDDDQDGYERQEEDEYDRPDENAYDYDSQGDYDHNGYDSQDEYYDEQHGYVSDEYYDSPDD